ncbi:MAG: hypothetical protein SFZ02_03990 [bacterium]|nr:hypothetical protein [bacterium]
MLEWIKIWFRGYQTTFDSPYPLDKCVEILREQTLPRTRYQKIAAALNIINLYIVIEQQSETVYTFSKHNLVLGMSLPAPTLWAEMDGMLETTPTGTRVTATITYKKFDWWHSMIFCAFIILLTMLIVAGIASEQSNLIVLVAGWIGLLASLFTVFGFLVGRPLARFANMPYTLLGGDKTS